MELEYGVGVGVEPARYKRYIHGLTSSCYGRGSGLDNLDIPNGLGTKSNVGNGAAARTGGDGAAPVGTVTGDKDLVATGVIIG